MRRPTAKPLSDLLVNVLKPAMQQHGLATSQLITRWAEIAGPELARVTQPLRATWPRGEDSGSLNHGQPLSGTLVLQVEPAFALDVQHEAQHILERVNALYGWKAMAKLSLRQGPVDKKREVAAPSSLGQAPELPQVSDDDLRAALQKLGQNVASGLK